MKTNALILFLLSSFFLSQGLLQAQTAPGVHDPVMIKQDGTYYLFCTGWGIRVLASTDMVNWERGERVFEEPPAWTKEAVPSFRGHMWAPDIAYFNGEYYLYYSISAFGKNTSCIGLATNKTLDPESPDFKWVDQGKVIQSIPDETNWNAIDPNLITDKKGNPYLSFGSFWNGLMLVKMAPDAKSYEGTVEDFKLIASRKRDPNDPNPPATDNNPVDAGGNAIEAPFIFKKGKYYYLFASIDYCCKGANSTYKMIVGRSKKVEGPYIDKDGADMAKGGGTILLAGDENWHGVGHNAAATFDGKDYLIFHGYSAKEDGHAKLIVKEISWDKDKWPTVTL